MDLPKEIITKLSKTFNQDFFLYFFVALVLFFSFLSGVLSMLY